MTQVNSLRGTWDFSKVPKAEQVFAFNGVFRIWPIRKNFPQIPLFPQYDTWRHFGENFFYDLLRILILNGKWKHQFFINTRLVKMGV